MENLNLEGLTPQEAITKISNEKLHKVIKKVLDSSPTNPFEDWGCEIPLMYLDGDRRNTFVTDFSNNDISEFIKGRAESYEGKEELLSHFGITLTDLFENDFEDCMDNDVLNKEIEALGFYLQDYDNKEDLVDDIISDSLSNLPNSVKELASLAEFLGLTYYHAIAKGYCQGDWAEALIVPTQKWADSVGVELESIDEKQLKGTFDLFSYWAFGDCYGYVIENSVGEVLDACYGFFGISYSKDLAEQVVENIDLDLIGMNRESFIKHFMELEVEY